MLLDAILKAIKEIESIDERSKDMNRVLENLKDTVNVRMKENLMDFMSVGEKMGYDEIKKQLTDLIGFIDSVEEKNKK
ncbi:hypothetical protein [Kordia sp.]|uniref:hypothetical protein n=1 Tax=Kordia sp. TaxID=1965332 RepID=UPI003D2829F7